MKDGFFEDNVISWSKLLLIMFIILLLTLSIKAFSAPFLVCDWIPQILDYEKLIYYEVIIDPILDLNNEIVINNSGEVVEGTLFKVIPQKDKTTGNVRLKYDLIDLTLGTHIITVRAVNKFDLKSDIVIIKLERKYPEKPINIMIK